MNKLFLINCLWLILSLSCEPLKRTSSSGEDDKTCARFNNQKAACEKALDEAGAQCRYDDASDTCSAESAKDHCGKITTASVCKEDILCLYDSKTNPPKCNDAGSLANTCAALETERSCTKDTASRACSWDGSSCDLATTDVYVWRRLSLPAGVNAADLYGPFSVSGDKKHIYAQFSSHLAAGVVHSADQGKTWTRLGPANNGVLSAKVRAAAPSSATYDSTNPWTGLSDSIPTAGGVVLKTLTSIFILEGDTPKWAIDSTINHNGAPGADRVVNFVNDNIEFADVITLGGREMVVFGQRKGADTHYRVWMHPTMTDFNKAATSMMVVKTNGAAFTDKQHWVVAGTTYSGDLLLGSNTGKAKGSGVWRIPVANLDSLSANFGRVAQDKAVLFPENAALGVNWLADGPNENLKIGVVGSFDHLGTDHYFAGMNRNLINANLNGLAHFLGPQGVQHAARDFVGKSIAAISRFKGTTRLFSPGNGLLGVATDGTPLPANNFSFASLAANQLEMMEDGTAVPLTASDDNAMVYGDDDLSYYYIYGKAYYSRTKERGKPRH